MISTTRHGAVGDALRRIGPAAGLWLLGLLIGALTLRDWIQLNDEGLMLQAAARISEGQVPYRDFWWFYPPGQAYLLGIAWKFLGPSLLPWRVIRAVVNATVALLVWRLARRRSGPSVSLLAWAVAILAVSSATGPHPYPIAIAFSLGCLLLLDRHPAAAGAALGVVAIWRIEFAVFLLMGCVLGLVVRGGWRKPVGRFVGAGALVASAVYLPLAAIAGPGRTWELLVRYPVLEFGKYQTLPFPLVWDGGGNARGADLIAQFLSYHAPLVLILVLILSLVILALAIRPGRWIELSTGVFAIGMANYLFVRADAFHTGPLALMDAVLGAWAISAVLSGRKRRPALQGRPGSWRPRLLIALLPLVALGLLWSLGDTAWKRSRELSQARAAVPLTGSVADGVRELPIARCSLRGAEVEYCRLADLESAVSFVRNRVPADRGIYVATRRSDLVTAGAPLFYVLAGRSNVTPYDIAAPGILTSAGVQREIIGRLERLRPVVVRYTASITAAPEPNLAGKSSGVTLLDAWLAANYREAARFGVWTVFEPSPGARAAGAEAR